jgi:hypothetical protein
MTVNSGPKAIPTTSLEAIPNILEYSTSDENFHFVEISLIPESRIVDTESNHQCDKLFGVK